MFDIRPTVGAPAFGTACLFLAGCTGSATPDWFKPAPPPPQALQFQSTPPGANVQTAQGQTCRTPCTLAVPVVSQSVIFSLEGYVGQTVPISVREAAHSLFNTKPPDLVPNPVQVALQAVPPPPPKAKPKLRGRIAAPKAKPVAATPPPMPSVAPVPMTPSQASTSPPPTPWPQSAPPSPFSPPGR